MSASWKRALAAVQEEYESGNRSKYKIKGSHYDHGWVYQLTATGKKIPLPSIKLTFTQSELQLILDRLPNCVARANKKRGGDFKLAFPSESLVQAVARIQGKGYYKCEIPFPAFGPHWHLRTK